MKGGCDYIWEGIAHTVKNFNYCAIIMGVLNTPSISFACCPHRKFGVLPFQLCRAHLSLLHAHHVLIIKKKIFELFFFFN